MRYLAMVVLAACGSVHGQATPDASSTDAPDQTPPTTYHAMLDHSTTVQFGGMPHCKYTITLKQLDVAIAITASGRVTSAMVQDLNVEAIVPPCPYDPAPPTIANYSLDSAKSVTGGTQLTFKGAAGNAPVVALTAMLQSTGSVYSANLGFLRTDQTGDLVWTVTAMLALAPE